MRNFEALLQYLAPLMFLGIWAVTSLLNRDSQPLPQRPGRPGNGPRPAGPVRQPTAAGRGDGDSSPLASPPPRRPAPAPAEPRRPERPAPSPQRPAAGRRPSSPMEADVYVIDDELLFVDPTTRAPIASASLPGAPQRGNPRPAPQRKPSRGRKQEQAAARGGRRPEAETQRALSEQVGQSLAEHRGRTAALTPLTSNLASISGQTLLNTTSVAAEIQAAAGPSLSAVDVKKMTAEPGRLREMAIVAEILQPPVSLRRSRRGI